MISKSAWRALSPPAAAQSPSSTLAKPLANPEAPASPPSPTPDTGTQKMRKGGVTRRAGSTRQEVRTEGAALFSIRCLKWGTHEESSPSSKLQSWQLGRTRGHGISCLLAKPEDLRVFQLIPGTNAPNSPGSLSTHISIPQIRTFCCLTDEGNRGTETLSPRAHSHDVVNSRVMLLTTARCSLCRGK